jgi:histidinol phosphatase-like PHP family hydrolase
MSKHKEPAELARETLKLLGERGLAPTPEHDDPALIREQIDYTRAQMGSTIQAISELCDFVMASVHRFIGSDGRTLQFEQTDPDAAIDLEFDLSWAVLANPQVDILGHMFGMSYRRFKRLPPDDRIRPLIARAAEYGVAVEVNSYYHPNPYRMIEWCREFDAFITFGSNAHSLAEVGEIMRLLERQAKNA